MSLERLLAGEALNPRWSTASALVYIGGFTILGAGATLLGTLGDLHGTGALIGYSALACALAIGFALALQQRDRAVAAGVIATVAVVFFAVLVAAVENQIGILDTDVGDYQLSRLILEVATIAASLVALRRFRAPLLVLPIALTFWIALVDVGTSGEAFSILAGVLLIAAGVVVDRVRRPYGFWLHLLGGVALGAGVLGLVSGGLGWALVGLLSVAYVAAAYLLARSSYAVLGAAGILATTTYFTFDAVSLVGAFLPFGAGPSEAGGLEAWQAALWFVAVGLLIVGFGLVEDRFAALRRR